MPLAPKPRLRLKRRVVSQLSAPTQQFLASVAAADVPIPSIEEPVADPNDFEMTGMNPFCQRPEEIENDVYLLKPRGRLFSPPKTPAPGFVPSLTPSRYPNWTIDSNSSIESTPDCDDFSRPSTSRSTLTSASLFSHLSQTSDDDQCISPEIEGKDRFPFARVDPFEARPQTQPKGKSRKAPWTKAMTDHLWSVYVLYLQDPKVTPFRMGKSCIPPHGVCLRVAREAKRSWKGSKSLAKIRASGEERKSGSTTPTAESSGAFIQWPHTCAATRAQLRELCKAKAATGQHNPKFMSRGSTPFGQATARQQTQRSTPAPHASGFAQDLSMSLALSTSETMQPQGPLAQLTQSNSELSEFPALPSALPVPSSTFPDQRLETFDDEPSFAERRRLGSPFGARSYGPSSTGSLAAVLGLTGPMPRRQTLTVGPRRTLQSPARLSRSGTQKRRNTHTSDPRKRPSVGSDLWLEAGINTGARVEAPRPMDFGSYSFGQHDDLFAPRTPTEPVLATSISMPDVGAQLSASALAPPPRLGSPFSASTNTSHSFPNRFHRSNHVSVDLGMLGRPFATIQQLTESNEQSARPNLAGRLAYIDQRLRELRRRDVRRRSESPL